MKKRILCIVNVLWWMCFALYFISSAVLEIGTNETLYFELQTRAGLPESAGISAEALEKLDVHLSSCLRGREDWNVEWLNPEGGPLRVVVDGVEQDAFNAREIQHMEDCQRLFDLLRTLRLSLAVAAALLVLLSLILELREKSARTVGLSPLWIGSLMIAVPLAIFGIWAVIDFNSAFNLFHRMLFTNDLWLLNPETDLLIRICPSSMFANMGLRIGLRVALILLGMPVLLSAIEWISNRVRKRRINETVEL